VSLKSDGEHKPYRGTVPCEPSVSGGTSELDSPLVVVVCGCDGSDASVCARSKASTTTRDRLVVGLVNATTPGVITGVTHCDQKKCLRLPVRQARKRLGRKDPFTVKAGSRVSWLERSIPSESVELRWRATKIVWVRGVAIEKVSLSFAHFSRQMREKCKQSRDASDQAN
jgi:hypothetical protein